MINKVYFSSLNLNKLIKLAERSNNILEVNHSDNLLIISVVENVGAIVSKAQSALGTGMVKNLTTEVFQKDTYRDETFKGLRMLIDAGSKRHARPDFQKASFRLAKVFDSHGKNLYRWSYEEQTKALKALFKDLGKEQAAKDLQMIGGSEWLEELKHDQKAFDEVFLRHQRQQEDQERSQDREVWLELKPALENLYTVLNALATTDQVEDLEQTIEQINSEIDLIMKDPR
ncbi:MAG: DUF6261 family protein [Bacteroidota bacterium]